MSSKIRITITNESLGQIVDIVAGGALLVSNAFLVFSGLKEQAASKRRQETASRLQGFAELAAGLASLARVISQSLDRGHGPHS